MLNLLNAEATVSTWCRVLHMLATSQAPEIWTAYGTLCAITLEYAIDSHGRASQPKLFRHAFVPVTCCVCIFHDFSFAIHREVPSLTHLVHVPIHVERVQFVPRDQLCVLLAYLLCEQFLDDFL